MRPVRGVLALPRLTATGRVRPERGGWEEVPYWLRGYADLAIVTGDATAPATTRPAASLRRRSTGRARGDSPFTLDGTPLTMTARARRVPEWTADDEHVVAPLQPSPAR